MKKIIISTFVLTLSLAACDAEDRFIGVPDGTRPDSSTPDGSVPDGTTPDATVAMPRGAANPPTPGAQIDRTGRPAISTALVGTFMSDADMKNTLKDSYNANTDPSTWAATFAAPIRGSLAILDALDANCGNQLLADDEADNRYDALAGVLADDRLYVNAASGTCGVYLGVEARAVGVDLPEDCGGRTLNDDVIDRSYSVLAAGILSGVDDTITEDAATHSLTEFPFVAAPN